MVLILEDILLKVHILEIPFESIYVMVFNSIVRTLDKLTNLKYYIQNLIIRILYSITLKTQWCANHILYLIWIIVVKIVYNNYHLPAY